MAAVAVLLCAIVGVLVSSRPTFASFLQVPDPLNVTVGAVAKFFCRADGDTVFWTVNGTSVENLDDPNITPDDGPVEDGVHTEILRIAADIQYSNSMIRCVSFTIIGEEVTVSAPALLMVQGLLPAPTNMQASLPDKSAIHLYWDPPFTLNITNVDPDISGYTVSITNTNTNVTSEMNVAKPEFLFQEEGYDPCHVYLFEVSALNPVGVGNTSDVMNKCFGGDPQSANVDWTMRDLPAERRIILHLIITYDMTCHGRRPEDIDIIIITSDGSQMQVDPPPTLSQTERLDLRLNFTVDNAPCGIRVTVMNTFGNAVTEVMIEEDCQLISTEDVTEESSPEKDPVIPVVVGGICGAVLVIVLVAILIVIFVKFRGERDVDIEDFAAKDNQYTDVPTTAERQTSLHNSEIRTSLRNIESHSPSASSTDSQTPLVPNRIEPTASQPPFVPSREPTASQPPFVPSRKATAPQPPFVPSRKTTASQPPFVPSREPTASQKNSELQYAVIATPQQQPQAPLISQRVAYALLKPQDTKVSTEHEN